MAAHAAEPAETLKVGVIGPLSGPAALWGTNMETILEVIADEVNGKGGLKVGNKVYTIKIIPYDDKYQGEAALTAANRLIYEDKVKYIFGPMGSASILSAQTATEKEKVLLIMNGFTKKGISPDKPFTFRCTTTPFEYAVPEAAWLASNRNVKSVVVVLPNSETGREGAEGNRIGFQKAGIKILSEEIYEPGAPDMLPLVTRLMRYKPDLLDFDGGNPGDSVNIAKIARTQGYKGMMSKLGGGGETCVQAAPDVFDGFMFQEEADINAGGKLGELIKEVRRRKPQNPVDMLICKYYVVFGMLSKAMQIAGAVDDTNAVRLALEKIEGFPGPDGGTYSWTGKETYGINHQLRGPIVFAGASRGKIVLLDKLTY
jgi:branched-chain amino acid transport system substrate-binding protein